MLDRKKQLKIFLGVNAGLLLVVLLFPLYRALMAWLPEDQCNMVQWFHLYCPGCGGTRAFQALYQFDILASLMYNPIVVVGGVILVIYELTMIKHLIQKTERGSFVNMKVFWVLFTLWMVYFVVRNVLLLFGIDVLGDIIV